MDLSIPPVKKNGSHGSHWAAILGHDEEIGPFIVSTLSRLASSEPVAEGGIFLNVSGGNQIATSAIISDYTLTTAYPTILQGITHDVMVREIDEWRNELEGQITGSLGPAAISFFDTKYVRNKRVYRSGQVFRFNLAALVYSLNRVDSHVFETPEGKTISTKGMAAFFPMNDGDIDDYWFQTTIKTIETVNFEDGILYRIVAPLFRDETQRMGMCDMDIPIYISAGKLREYSPVVGDDIQGFLWLQGHLD
jgi:hypothetical protein